MLLLVEFCLNLKKDFLLLALLKSFMNILLEMQRLKFEY